MKKWIIASIYTLLLLPMTTFADYHKPSNEVKEKLMNSINSNPAVVAILNQSAKEAGLDKSQCTIEIIDAKGEKSELDGKIVVDGTIEILQTCNNTEAEVEAATMTTIKASVYSDFGVIDSVIINRAG